MSMTTLSDDAQALLRLHLSGRYLSMRRSNPESLPGRTADETRCAYNELVDAGLMIPVSTFAGGPEAIYRLTPAGDLQESWIGSRSRDHAIHKSLQACS
jgi:hypothetical protein